jgi:hypothetical protein
MDGPNQQERLSLTSLSSQVKVKNLTYWAICKLQRKCGVVNTVHVFDIVKHYFFVIYGPMISKIVSSLGIFVLS